MARLTPGLKELLKETFDWEDIVINGNEPSQFYVAVNEACRDYAMSYNQTWSVFEGYKGGDGASATDIGRAPPRRRRRKR
jgi:hypothetical protein